MEHERARVRRRYVRLSPSARVDRYRSSFEGQLSQSAPVIRPRGQGIHFPRGHCGHQRLFEVCDRLPVRSFVVHFELPKALAIELSRVAGTGCGECGIEASVRGFSLTGCQGRAPIRALARRPRPAIISPAAVHRLPQAEVSMQPMYGPPPLRVRSSIWTSPGRCSVSYAGLWRLRSRGISIRSSWSESLVPVRSPRLWSPPACASTSTR